MSAYNDNEGSGHFVAVTPNDSADLPGGVTRAILVGTGGNVRVTSQDGDTVTLPNLLAGVTHSFKIRRVFSTDTTAGSIVAIY